MNVALYSPLDPTLVGGMRTWLVEFWRRYTESRRINLTVVHSGTRPAASANAYRALDEHPRIHIQKVAGITIPGSGGRLPSVAALTSAIAGTDLLYVDNGYALQDGIALAAARGVGVPVVSGHHSVITHEGPGVSPALHNLAWNLVGRRKLPQFDIVHALNRIDAEYLRTCGGKNVRVAHLPVDVDTFVPGEKADRFTVLFAGRLHPQKGIDRLVAFSKILLARLGERVEIRIIGDGPEVGTLRDLGLDPRVVLLRPMDRVALASEMRRAHVLVAPSRTETFGFVVAEALASGTAVVCSSTHGFLDLMNERTGTILPQSASPDMWFEAVARFAPFNGENDAIFRGIGAAAREQACSFAFDRVAAEFDQIVG